MQKPPTTFKGFLEFQHLKDWPEDPFVEEPLTVACTADTKYSLDVINEDLCGSVPFSKNIYAEIDEKVSKITSLLDKYTSQILCLPCSDDHLAPITETFLTEVDVPDSSLTANSQVKIKACLFPGFKSLHVTELPGKLEAAQILNCVAKNQSLKGSRLKVFEKLFLSSASVTILQDSFWWLFLQKFKPDDEQQDKFFNRISDSFVTLFCGAPQEIKDFFFMIYPDCMSQSIYTAFYEAFPDSLPLFNDEFKSEITDLIFEWMSGIKPLPRLWTKWNLGWLGGNSPNPARKDRETYNDLLSTSLIHDGRGQWNFNIDDLIQDARDTSLPKTVEEKVVPARESHGIGPGPEFHHVLFKLGGHSPLVLNYLERHKFTTFVSRGANHKLKRTEIKKLPPVGPTYQEVIKETQKLRKTFRHDYAILEAKTQKERAEIELQKQRVNLHIERMKEEISNGVKPKTTRLLEKLQRMSFASNVFKQEGLTIKELLNSENGYEQSF
ncbi:protein FAM227B [Pelobates fuscus]|uniref:protein FAM227B n=1 Tax=Pelobates fuscus TaxID=191477 RepID=UPI002FE46954